MIKDFGKLKTLLDYSLGEEGLIVDESLEKIVDKIHEDLSSTGIDDNDEYDSKFNSVWAEKILELYDHVLIKKNNNLYGVKNMKEVLLLDGSQASHVFNDAQTL